MKIIAIIPTYNEKENIGRLIEQINRLNLGIDVLVIDDNSPDGTGSLIDNIAQDNPAVHVMHRSKKLGLGTAYMGGFRYALEKEYDCVFTMDADFSHNPEYMPIFLEALKEFDAVVGSRYIDRGGVLGWPLHRRLLSKFGNMYAKAVTGLKVSDCTSGFMCMNRKAIVKTLESGLRSEGYGFLIERKYILQKYGFRITEIPIMFVDRIAGKSKISRNIIFEALFLVWKLRLGLK